MVTLLSIILVIFCLMCLGNYLDKKFPDKQKRIEGPKEVISFDEEIKQTRWFVKSLLKSLEIDKKRRKARRKWEDRPSVPSCAPRERMPNADKMDRSMSKALSTTGT